ncbi:SPFH domain-containing protein [Patescibacteria group bacterium]|nr:SPFH domain-containing protein [Patescibacteria group bacterium]MBU4477365.1 SPFH domain-containing protein [Patescibacteria group bacterium]
MRENETKESVAKKVNVLFLATATIINILIVAVAWFLWQEETTKILGQEWNWGWAIIFALILYNIFSLKIAKATNDMTRYGTVWGVVEVFGRPVYGKGPGGLFYVPLGIANLILFPYTTIEDQYPDDPEKVWKGEQDKIPVGMVPPIRLTSSGSEKETKDPLERRLTLEISFVNRWRITNPILFRKTIGTIDEFGRQIKDIVIRTGGQEIAQKKPKEVLEEWEKIDEKLKKIVKETSEGWGVETQNVFMAEFDPSKRVNTAMADATEALYLRKKKETDALAQKFADEQKGAGEGAAEKAILDGRTAGFEKMAKKLKIKSELVLNAETARAITSNPGQKTIIVGPQGFADIVGITTAIGENLKTKSEV